MQKLYYGGDIITMREEGDAPEALLAADGKIVYVGELAEARKRCLPEAEEIDLKGRTLMPSFIDPHSHISMLAQYTDFANQGKCTSFEELVRLMVRSDMRKVAVERAEENVDLYKIEALEKGVRK